MYKNQKIQKTSLYQSAPIVGIVLLLLSLNLSGCLEEDEFFDFNEPLSFSVDTLRFDTVFTSLGSATRQVKVQNTTDQNIRISSVRFKDRDRSKFRMNIDGIPANQLSNVEILAKDSIYIFVEVTIDPDQPISISPFVISDAIVLEGQGISQSLILEAWGQNANYIPNRFNTGQLVRLTCGNSRVDWDDPKPYVIYGILFIDSCQLALYPGTQIYVHGGLAQLEGNVINDGALFFQKDGVLISEGTLDDPVVFQGDRLESSFQEVSGQWTGIRLLAESKGHIIRNTIIKNSIVGIRADSATSLVIDKTQIFNTSNAAVIGVHSDMSITNSLFYLNGSYSLLMGYGGDYDVAYTTFANYENQNPALYMDNFLCRDANCQVVDVFPLKARFTNCIIAGSNDDEILFVDVSEGQEPELFNVNYENCIVKIDELTMDQLFLDSCSDCTEMSIRDSLFTNLDDYDLTLHDMSIALDKGQSLENISDDILGNLRDAVTPDLGCYESQQ